MNYVLPLVLSATGLRIIFYPSIASWKHGWTIDLSGYQYLVGGPLLLLGAILLADALGYTKRWRGRRR